MSDLEKVEAAVSRWMGRVGNDTAAHVDSPVTVTVTLNPDGTHEIKAAHAEGSEAPEGAGEAEEPYGTPHQAPVPFGESGLAGRNWGADQQFPLPDKVAAVGTAQEPPAGRGDAAASPEARASADRTAELASAREGEPEAEKPERPAEAAPAQ